MFAVARLLVNNKLSLCSIRISLKLKNNVDKEKSRSGAIIKKLHCGEVFKAANSFYSGKLPTTRLLIELMLIFPDFRTCCNRSCPLTA